MSQIIVSDKIYKRGKDIEEYLGSRYSEPWFSKTRSSEKNEKYETTFCPYYFKLLERPYWESRYNGIRAKCKACEVIYHD